MHYNFRPFTAVTRVRHPLGWPTTIFTNPEIHLPGKSAGEIGHYFDPAYHAVSRELGGILLLGDAIIGHPPAALGLIPEQKLRLYFTGR